MTTANTSAKTSRPRSGFQLPDPPECEPDDMTCFKHLVMTGNAHFLKAHLGNAETTVVGDELYLALDRRGPGTDFRIPDLLVAFDADPELHEENNGYVISEQGNPPDFVLEIASPSNRATDNTVKRDFYARHGVLEYWHFDEQEAPGQPISTLDDERRERVQAEARADTSEARVRE